MSLLPLDRLSRRSFLKASITASACVTVPVVGMRPGHATPTLELIAEPTRKRLVGDDYPETSVWAFNGEVPGPTIRAVQGDRLRVSLTNRLAEPTTVHWHGLRVPASMDGVPYLSQPPVEPGQTFVYEFDLQDAGTYWYHPHIRSSEQVGRGLHGTLIVEETEPPVVDRELLWVLDDWRLDRDAKIVPFGDMHDASHSGRIGNTATINGEIRESEPVRAGERIRLRLVNVANARTFGLRFRDLDPWVVALDGQPVTPHQLGDVPMILGAGMRADLIIDMTGDPGAESLVIDAHYGRDHAYELIRFAYMNAAPVRSTELPEPPALRPNPIAEPDLTAAKRHRIVFEGGAMGGMRGAMMGGRMMGMRDLVERGRVWAMNGAVPEDLYDAPPMMALAAGTSHVIELVNRTAFEHPLHLHGHTFRIIARDGRAEPNPPFRDTVLLQPDESAEIAFVADNPGQWMFHCHVLEHQETGMMGVVDVA